MLPSVTVDETGAPEFALLTTQQSNQWLGAGGSEPKKLNSHLAKNFTVFYNTKRVLLFDYLDNGKMISGDS